MRSSAVKAFCPGSIPPKREGYWYGLRKTTGPNLSFPTSFSVNARMFLDRGLAVVLFRTRPSPRPNPSRPDGIARQAHGRRRPGNRIETHNVRVRRLLHRRRGSGGVPADHG